MVGRLKKINTKTATCFEKKQGSKCLQWIGYLLILIKLSGKDNSMLICIVFTFEIKALWYTSRWDNTAEWSQKSIMSLVLIYQ